MTFEEFARSHGLVIDSAIADGRWHRTQTLDKRKSKKNGAYLFDGERGVVKNWATMEHFSRYPQTGFKPIKTRPIYSGVQDAERHARAALEAMRIVSEASLAKHPYLVRKGFPEALGLVLGENLIVPMRDHKTGQLLSIQSIGEQKKFLAGGRAKGAVFTIGPKKATQKWLVEGYATGLSVKAALDALYIQAQVCICFSASNLQYVADKIPGRRFVFADHDESGTGQRAAEATGLPWVMSPVLGEDANDLHQRAGIWELVKLVKSLDVKKSDKSHFLETA